MTSPTHWIASYLHAGRRRVLAVAGALIAVIAVIDARVAELSLGFLYILPVVLASGFLNRWQIVVLSLVCTILREIFSNDPLTIEAIGARVLIILSAFGGAGLFVSEVSRNRRLMAENLSKLQEQIDLRRRAEEELGVVVETSPAAIFIVDGSGRILEANDSATALLGFGEEAAMGQGLFRYLPALETVPRAALGRKPLRSNLECRGRRQDGTSFLAQVWLSTYQTADGPRMAAIVFDTSETLRDRDGGGLRALMLTSRILMGAVSHSVRNLCAAARVAYANLQRDSSVAEKEDFQALGTVVRGLESIASAELSKAADRAVSTVDPNTLLDEFRIVIEPAFAEDEIDLSWDVRDGLPLVFGEHYGLLHALLNLAQNSQRELARQSGSREFRVIGVPTQQGIELRLIDNAGGVRNPESLFQPFQTHAGGSGLGLYVARAITRTFEGDLRYEPTRDGSAFIIELSAAHSGDANLKGA